jgi:uncharacterized protein (TIGR02246 family)
LLGFGCAAELQRSAAMRQRRIGDRKKVEHLIRRIAFAIIILLSNGAPFYAFGSDNGEDEKAIRELIAATTEAFNKHDAYAFTQLYTPDAVLVTVRGERVIGKIEIQRVLSELFSTRAKAASLRTLDVQIRFIKPDVALAHVVNEMRGIVNNEGSELPPHKELSIRVLTKEKDTWRVAAFHNTIVTGWPPKEK